MPVASQRDFARGPFEAAPPTHLPIGFLFWFHLLLFVILALLAVMTRSVKLGDYDYQYYNDVNYFLEQEMTWRVFWRALICFLLGVGGSILVLGVWGLFVCASPTLSIWLFGALALFSSGLLCAFAMYAEQYFLGSLLACVFLLVLVTSIGKWRRVTVTASLYRKILQISLEEKLMRVWVGLAIVLLVIYSLCGLVAAVAFLAMQQFAVLSDFLGVLCTFYFVFSWYWTTKVIKNVGGVIAGSLIGQWYFFQTPWRDALASGLDGASRSLGSICLGSLIIPPVGVLQYLNTMCCSHRSSSPPVLEIYKQCNAYAFTHICIFGTTFFDASIDALRAFSASGVEVILNDAALGTSSEMVSITAGCLGALFGGVTAEDWTDYSGCVVFICFLIGYGIADVVIVMLDSCILALLMSVCIFPASLGQRAPRLREYLNRRYGTECESLLQGSG